MRLARGEVHSGGGCGIRRRRGGGAGQDAGGRGASLAGPTGEPPPEAAGSLQSSFSAGCSSREVTGGRRTPSSPQRRSPRGAPGCRVPGWCQPACSGWRTRLSAPPFRGQCPRRHGTGRGAAPFVAGRTRWRRRQGRPRSRGRSCIAERGRDHRRRGKAGSSRARLRGSRARGETAIASSLLRRNGSRTIAGASCLLWGRISSRNTSAVSGRLTRRRLPPRQRLPPLLPGAPGRRCQGFLRPGFARPRRARLRPRTSGR